jgi:hypothetical protein
VIYEKTFCGRGASEYFLECLYNSTRNLINNMNEKKNMQPMTKKEIKNFEKSTICHICKKAFNEYEIKCRDHNHRNGLTFFKIF